MGSKLVHEAAQFPIQLHSVEHEIAEICMLFKPPVFLNYNICGIQVFIFQVCITRQSMTSGVSRIGVYVGIPTQEFRSVVGDIANLVGELLSIPCEKVLDDEDFTFLVEGATSYSSIFGYWMGGGQTNRRDDDHTEVIEFIVDPEQFGITSLLMMTDVLFPAMFISHQQMILLVANHETEDKIGNYQLLIVPCKSNLASSNQSNNSVHSSRDKKLYDPLDCIGHTFDCLLRFEQPSGLTFSASDFDCHHWKDAINLSWLNWIGKHRAPFGKNWCGDMGTFALDFEMGDLAPPRTVDLPIPIIRLLVQATSWWQFFGASTLFHIAANKGESPNYEYWQKRTTEIDAVGANSIQFFRDADSVRELNDNILNSMVSWLRLGENESYFKSNSIYASSDDPIANGILWLSFVNDATSFRFEDFSSDEIFPSNRAFSPLPTKNRSARSKYKTTYTLCDVKNLIEQSTGYKKYISLDTSVLGSATYFRDFIQNPVENQVPTYEEYYKYMRTAIDYLEDVEDRYFPDRHLLDSWKLYLRLTKRLGQLSFLLQVNNSDDVCNIENSGWWVQTSRMWRQAPPTARMWLCPLMLDTCFAGLYGHLLRNHEYDKVIGDAWKETERGWRVSLNRSFDGISRDRSSTIRQLSLDSISGFPFQVKFPHEFIDAIQEDTKHTDTFPVLLSHIVQIPLLFVHAFQNGD